MIQDPTDTTRIEGNVSMLPKPLTERLPEFPYWDSYPFLFSTHSQNDGWSQFIFRVIDATGMKPHLPEEYLAPNEVETAITASKGHVAAIWIEGCRPEHGFGDLYVAPNWPSKDSKPRYALSKKFRGNVQNLEIKCLPPVPEQQRGITFGI